jgi:16S rRNA (adenine1518-N6/adenine1519-N6)-dimethyltransferase
MVQKEVADKLCGKEKASYLQLYVAFFYHIARVCNVSKNSFSPKPKVDSAVVQLTRRDVPIVDSEKRRLFFSFLREAFLKRRKTLVHSLEGIIEREVLLASLQRLNLSAAARVDDLDLSTWIQLFFAGLSPSS